MRTEPSFSADSEDNILGSANNSSDASDSQLLSDYRQRYGLSTDPFVDDPHFPFYPGAQRRQILEQLLHLCQFSQNLLVVTGEYGVGKTRMAQALIDALDDADDICFVEGQITSDINSLLAEVFAQFELNSDEEFEEFCKKKSEQDGLVVLIIDNAHHLTDEVIADLIDFLQKNSESRLHLVLFAEPYLLGRLENVNAPDVVLTDFFLEKFSLAEAVDYLNFRMEMADYLGPEIFIEAKVEPWWRQSQGQLLSLHDHAQEKLLASVSAPRTNKSYKPNLLVPHIIVSSILVGGLFVGYLYFGGDSDQKANSQVTTSVPIASHPDVSASSSLPVEAQQGSVAAVANVEASVVSASSSAPALSEPERTPVAAQVTQVARESVVPLAQTNEYTNQPVPRQGKASSAASVKEVKKAEVASEPAKAAAKVKSEGNNASAAKTASAFSGQEKTILSWDASEYTLQIVGVSNEKAALDFIASQGNKKDLLLFRSIRAGKDWFVVISGRYPSSSAARQAAKMLPESQQKSSPWPRDVKTIQGEIKQRTQ